LSTGPSAAGIVFSIPRAIGPVPSVASPPPPAPVLTPTADAPEPVKPPPPTPVVAESPAVYSPGRPVTPEVVGEAAAPIPSLGPALRMEAAKVRGFTNPAPEVRAVELSLQIQGSEPTYMEFGLGGQPSWSASTAFPEEGHGGERDQIKIIMETVEMGGIALSVGVGWWARRGGGLIGSLLASMPAWRDLGPLPIAGGEEGERRREEGGDDGD